MSFQKELKKVREQLGMTQSELGKAIGVSTELRRALRSLTPAPSPRERGE